MPFPSPAVTAATRFRPFLVPAWTLDPVRGVVAYCQGAEPSGFDVMKIYSLEFISKRDGAPERIWHTNRRALERFARTLEHSSYTVRGIRSFDLPTPLTEAGIVAFLNAYCADFMPPRATPRPPPVNKRRRTPGVDSG